MTDPQRSARAGGLEEHLASLRAFVRLRLGRALRAKEESQDVVQSVCREVLAEVERARDGRKNSQDQRFREKLFRAAEFKIRDRWRFWNRDRRAVARERSIDDAASADQAALLAGMQTLLTPSRHAASREELARLERAFAELSSEAREIVLLARVHGLSHAQIAARVGKSEVATRAMLSRALARLALVLGK